MRDDGKHQPTTTTPGQRQLRAERFLHRRLRDSVTVKVTLLSADPERTVTIPVSRANQGGASNGDYSGVPANVTFNSGDTEKTFSFSATDDTVDDDDESVKLGFGTLPTRVSEGSTTDETTVNITDDDDPR